MRAVLHIVQALAVVWLIALAAGSTGLLLVVAGQALVARLGRHKPATARRRRRATAGGEPPQDRQATA